MKKNLCLLLLLFIPILAIAQDSLARNIFLHKMENGLDVLVVEDNTVPLATIMITCKNGSYTEPPQYNGLSHLYEHMFFNANKDYESQEEFLAKKTELGLQANGTTELEKVDYYFTLSKFNLKQGLKFMNSAIRFPKFDPEDMKRENEVVDDEFKRQESNPGYVLNDAMGHHMWGDLYSRKNIIGDHNIIHNATPDLMDSIKNKYYYPNNALLTIAGDVDHVEVFKQAEKIYGSWKPSAFNPFEKWPVPEFSPLTKTDYFIVESPIAQVPVIRMEWIGPDTRNDVQSTYVADIFSGLVNQNSSRFLKALTGGLVVEAGAGYTTLAHGGTISIGATPIPAKIKECLAELKRQISIMDADDYFTDEQIAAAKQKIEIGLIRQQEVTSAFVRTLSYWWASASLAYYTSYDANIQKVTKADLQNYVRKYIKDKPYCAGLLISPDMNAKVNAKEFFTAN